MDLNLPSDVHFEHHKVTPRCALEKYFKHSQINSLCKIGFNNNILHLNVYSIKNLPLTHENVI